MKWRKRALADIARLHGFLLEKNPDVAMRASNAIWQGAKILTENPALGRPMSDGSGMREWLIAFGAGAYVLRYKLDLNEAIILRVWHNRENRA